MSNNWLLLFEAVMLMTPFRWMAYLTWDVWNGFQEFWIRVREHQFENTLLVFLASKVIRLSFSCELSLQISNCGISSLGSIVCYCCESCWCCCGAWKEAFAASMSACNSGHLSCHSLKKTSCDLSGFVV